MQTVNDICQDPHPRLLVVGSFLETSPLERYPSGDLAQRLCGRGWQVEITSRRTSKLVRLCDMLWFALRQRSHYDVALVDVFSGPAFVWAEAVTALLRRLGKAVVLALHGGNLPAFSERHGTRVRRLLSSARIVTAPSTYLLRFMRPYKAELQLLPNAIDVNRYAFHLRSFPSPSLVWLRAFCSIYNPEMAIAVLNQILTTHRAATLSMAGPDKNDGSLARTVAAALACGTIDRIRIAGHIPKAAVPSWLNTGDIFLNTTNVDNTPVSVIEAMACGLCVVSTKVGGLPDLVCQGEDGLLVPGNDPLAMTEAVRRVLVEPGLAQRLSENARAKAERFDWALILPQWEALLRQGAGSGLNIRRSS